MQKTVTIKIDTEDLSKTQDFFEEQGLVGRDELKKPVLFHFSTPGLTIVGYSSGSIVFQGTDWKVDDWAGRVNEFISISKPANYDKEIGNIGCDEAGKGEFWGPLVLGAFFIPDEDISKELVNLGVTDSKKLSDRRVEEIANEIYVNFPDLLRVQSVLPEDLNKKWSEKGNLSQLMADEYTFMLDNFVEDMDSRHGDQLKEIIVDQFTTKKERMPKEIQLLDRGVEIMQTPKGERFLAVAAGSILARNEYLKWLEVKAEVYGMVFPKGYSESLVVFGKNFIDRFGEDEFEKVAKTFFKTRAAI